MEDKSKSNNEIDVIKLFADMEDRLRPDVFMKDVDPLLLKECWRGEDRKEIEDSIKFFEKYEMYEFCQALTDLLNEEYK